MIGELAFKEVEHYAKELESEYHKYRNLFEFAPIGIFQSTVDGRVLNVNPAHARIFGYDSVEDYISSVKNIAQDIYVYPEERERLIDLALAHHNLSNFESQFRRKDGKKFHGLVHLRVERDAEGSVKYLEGFIEDITEQKKIAAALQKSEEYYRGIFENTGTGTIITEEDMTISLANAGFEAMSGYSKAEVEGKMKWPDIVAYAEDRERMTQYHLQRRKGPHLAPKNYEFTLIDKSGNKKNIYLRTDIVPGTRKGVSSFIDITPLFQAQERVRESESKLRGVLEAFDGFIYTCTMDFRITYMNKSMQEHIGRHVTGQRCYRMIYGLNEPCEWCAHNGVFDGKTIKMEFQNPRNGRWYYGVSSPIMSANGTAIKKQTVLIDIHEKKLAEIDMKDREQLLQKENVRLRASIKDRYKFGNIVGKSLAMQKVYGLILKAAASDANVIIYGESGTGKELVAHAIHDMSDRGSHKLVPVNCGAIPQHLLESEFYGYKRGAFTGATQDKAGFLDHAENGTLFLDELGEIDLSLQVKLLRALEGAGYTPVGGREVKKTNVRIIAATNRDLSEMVKKGLIRKDFFYRIYIIPIYLPPLRERKEDIPLLVEHFLKKLGSARKVPPLTGSMIESLIGYDWPGNVRELENTLQRFVNLDDLDFLDFFSQRPTGKRKILMPEEASPELTLSKAVKRFEKEYILQVLEKYNGNKSKVARFLEIGRKTLYMKMNSLGIEY